MEQRQRVTPSDELSWIVYFRMLGRLKEEVGFF